jgi:magnesium transporter
LIADSAHYVEGARQDDDPLSLDEARRRAQEGPGYVWMSLADPSAEELEQARTAFDLPALAVEDAQEGHQRPKLEQYGDDSFLVVKTVTRDEGRSAVEFGELDIFLGERHAVVTGWQAPAALAAARERLDAHPDTARLGPFAVAWAVLDEVVDAYEPAFDRLEDALENVEQTLFGGESEQGQRIYLIRREVVRLARALYPLLGPTDELEQSTSTPVPEQLRPLFRDIGDHVHRLYEEAVQLGQVLDALLNANLAAVSVRQNVVVQKLSGWAAIAVVPTIITGIYGMNFRHMPELGWVIGYPLALALMIAVVFGLWWHLKRVGWL